MTENTADRPFLDPASEQENLSVYGYVAASSEDVYEAVADPAVLSKYFATGGAQGRLDTGVSVSWDFADFPGRFPVYPVEHINGERLVFEWAAPEAGVRDTVRVIFEFDPVDDGTRTKVTITEGPYSRTHDGIQAALGNAMGWTGMLAALKMWLEHGINLREGFYA